MQSDKNSAMINFLLNCPTIANNPTFFNFAKIEENSTQFISVTNDTALTKTYVDGTELKRFRFTIATFKSISFNPMIKTPGFPDENLTELAEFQEVLDWVTEKSEAHQFPNFGTDCTIDSMKTTSDNPNLSGVDVSSNPPIATYSITIEIMYEDRSKSIWK